MTRYGAELWHEGVSRRDGAPGPGSGRYPLGSGKRPFQHGGRRYTNRDGSLTARGEKRYERDKRENLAKKKENRIDTSNPDPKRWAREDLERTKSIIDQTDRLRSDISKLEQSTRKKTTGQPVDLSKMTDAELRAQINRWQLEKQYSSLYLEANAPQVSRGRERVQQILELSGNVLAVGASAVGLALAIKQLKG